MSTTRLRSLLESAVSLYEGMEHARLLSLGTILPTLLLPSKLSQLTNIQNKMKTVTADEENQLARFICEDLHLINDHVDNQKDTEEKTPSIAIHNKMSKLEILVNLLKICAEFQQGTISFEDAKNKLESFKTPFNDNFHQSDFHTQTVNFVLSIRISTAEAEIKHLQDEANNAKVANERLTSEVAMLKKTEQPRGRTRFNDPGIPLGNTPRSCVQAVTETITQTSPSFADLFFGNSFYQLPKLKPKTSSETNSPTEIPANRMKLGNSTND